MTPGRTKVLGERLGVVEAAKTVGWSKATYYRHRAAQGVA